MIWNWRQADWPNFTYDDEAPQPPEDKFLRGGGVSIGATTNLSELFGLAVASPEPCRAGLRRADGELYRQFAAPLDASVLFPRRLPTMHQLRKNI